MSPVLEASTLDAGQTYLDEEVLQGRFTPFLGAGASSLRPAEPDLNKQPWSSIWSTVLAIRDGLEKPSQLRYLQTFAEQRMRIGKLASSELDATPEQMLRTEMRRSEIRDSNSLLLDFQRVLVRLAAEMGKVFGETFAVAHGAVSQVKDMAVKL